jgi:CRISP-associated protein Cas1
MQVAGRAAKDKSSVDPVGEVRRACRDVFRRTLLLQNIIPTIEDVLMSGDIPLPRLEREND